MPRGNYIYSIQNQVTGRAYIGTTGNIEQRWATHKTLLRAAQHHCIALQADWLSHGEGAFIFSIIEHLDGSKDRGKREREWIAQFEGSAPTYNTTKPGSHRPQNKNLQSYEKLPEGMRATKAFRFTLPAFLADKLESLPKEKRDKLMAAALEDA